MSEEEGFDDTFVVTGKHNENLLLKAESLPSPGNVDQENLESENFQQRLLEDANLAYQNLKLRMPGRNTAGKIQKSKESSCATGK